MNLESTSITATQGTADLHIRNGNSLFDKGRFSEACDEYRQAAGAKPDSANAHYNWARALAALDRTDEAINQYHEAIRLNPDLAVAHFHLGHYLATLGRFDEGLLCFEKAVSLHPGSSNGHFEYGAVLSTLGRYEEAISEFREAELLAKESDLVSWGANLYSGWGYALCKLNRFADSLERFERAISLDGDDAETYFWWGLSLGELERYQEAIRCYKKAARLDPQMDPVYNVWAFVLEKQEHYEEAIEKLKQAIEINPNNAFAYNSWGRILLIENEYEEATEKLNRAIELRPQLAEAHYHLGAALRRLGQSEEAMYRFKRASEVDPNMVDAYNAWGVMLHSAGKYEEAIEKYEAAKEINADYATPFLNIGVSLVALNRLEEAANQFRSAVRIDPNSPIPHNYLGLALARLKRYEEAALELNKSVQCDPNYGSAHHNLAYILWRQGKYVEARNEWNKALKVYENEEPTAKLSRDSKTFFHVGSIWHDVFAKLDKAERAYRDGFAVDPNNPQIVAALARLYLEMDEWQVAKGTQSRYFAARELYKKAVSLFNEQISRREETRTLLQLGQLHSLFEENDAAVSALERAIAVDDQLGEAHSELGTIAMRKADFTEASRLFTDALKRDPDSLDFTCKLAESYFRSGDFERAEKLYRRVLTLAANDINARIGLGELCSAMAELGDDDMFDEAIEHFEVAIEASRHARGSKLISPTQLGAVLYSRGYARVMSYENSRPFGDDNLLYSALDDFRKCVKVDGSNYKAKRAVVKIRRSIQGRISRGGQRAGGYLIFGLSLLLFGFTLWRLYRDQMPLGYGVALFFGSLVFMIAGLCLPQLLRLKVSGIELEKESVLRTTRIGSLSIERPSAALTPRAISVEMPTASSPSPFAARAEPPGKQR